MATAFLRNLRLTSRLRYMLILTVVGIAAWRYGPGFAVSPPQTVPDVAKYLQKQLGLHVCSTMADKQTENSLFLSRQPLTWEKRGRLHRIPERIDAWQGIVLVDEIGETQNSLYTDDWTQFSYRYKNLVFFGDVTLLQEVSRELSQIQ